MVSPQALGSDIEYPLRSNALSAKSVLGGRVALTLLSPTALQTSRPKKRSHPQQEPSAHPLALFPLLAIIQTALLQLICLSITWSTC